jgi:hypothetical protein
MFHSYLCILEYNQVLLVYFAYLRFTPILENNINLMAPYT